ncbi:Fc.00g040570.m01.CDS01 [Cosmosporella sp. VM-42]
MASRAPPPMNPWEVNALNYEFPDQGAVNPDGSTVTTATAWRQTQDPVIYPGLYSATGFDMMNILLRVMSRPEPKIVLGPVDCSVALILCDLCQPDVPIVYASEAFSELTGYSNNEAVGQNCRFLQAPPGKDRRSVLKSADKVAVKKMRRAVAACDEVQLEVTNYKKNGRRFTNILSIIPVQWDSEGYRYAVGFQCEKE